ncbi:MAG: M42 family peptidase, partial [Cyclobacteriaceae bacterium]|nr:M42 family peptidase [Cyclobacteriaceae bacterium]
MSINVELLKKLCETPGAPGFEKKIRDVVIQEINEVVDTYNIDNMGNVIAVKRCGKPDAPKVMLAAHMDEIGFMVTHIDDNGFVRFHTLGGFDPKTLTAQRVIIHGKEDVMGVMGSKPIHLMKPEERTKHVQIDEYFIDTGRSAEELQHLISIGDPITRERELVQLGSCINCKSLDNRISVYVLIEVLKTLKNPDVDVYGVFTVQEE